MLTVTILNTAELTWCDKCMQRQNTGRERTSWDIQENSRKMDLRETVCEIWIVFSWLKAWSSV
jgi:hypothetical protein